MLCRLDDFFESKIDIMKLFNFGQIEVRKRYLCLHEIGSLCNVLVKI